MPTPSLWLLCPPWHPVNSKPPAIRHSWCLVIPSYQICYHTQISYQLRTLGSFNTESTQFPGRISWPIILQRIGSSEALSIRIVASAQSDLCSKLRQQRNREGTAHKLRPHCLFRQRDQLGYMYPCPEIDKPVTPTSNIPYLSWT